MTGVVAYDTDFAFAFNHFTFITDFLYRSPYFHSRNTLFINVEKIINQKKPGSPKKNSNRFNVVPYLARYVILPLFKS